MELLSAFIDWLNKNPQYTFNCISNDGSFFHRNSGYARNFCLDIEKIVKSGISNNFDFRVTMYYADLGINPLEGMGFPIFELSVYASYMPESNSLEYFDRYEGLDFTFGDCDYFINEEKITFPMKRIAINNLDTGITNIDNKKIITDVEEFKKLLDRIPSYVSKLNEICKFGEEYLGYVNSNNEDINKQIEELKKAKVEYKKQMVKQFNKKLKEYLKV